MNKRTTKLVDVYIYDGSDYENEMRLIELGKRNHKCNFEKWDSDEGYFFVAVYTGKTPTTKEAYEWMQLNNAKSRYLSVFKGILIEESKYHLQSMMESLLKQ